MLLTRLCRLTHRLPAVRPAVLQPRQRISDYNRGYNGEPRADNRSSARLSVTDNIKVPAINHVALQMEMEKHVGYLEKLVSNSSSSSSSQTAVDESLPSATERDKLLAFLKHNHISLEVLKEFKVGLAHTVHATKQVKQLSLTFPLTDKEGKVHAVRHISLEEPSGRPENIVGGGMFWLNNTSDSKKKPVFLVGSELEAVALHEWLHRSAAVKTEGTEKTGEPTSTTLKDFAVVAMPGGEQIVTQPLVDTIKSIASKTFVWCQHTNQPKYTNKFDRVSLWMIDTKNMSVRDSIKANLDIMALVNSATNAEEGKMITFRDRRDIIKSMLLNPTEQAGVKSQYFKTLDTFLGGHRRGELTVVTGPTGIGKTTILAQLSIDYAQQNVRTLWGSFEIKNDILMSKMLKLTAGKLFDGADSSRNEKEFDEAADKFEKLPIFYLTYFSSTKIKDLLDTMKFGYTHKDVEHIIIDNLQFMVSGQATGTEKFDVMDNAISALRHFATEYNVHITVVIHPRKESDDQELMTSSFYGSAKPTQEADNVIIIQRVKDNENARIIDIRKNRFNGRLGRFKIVREADGVYTDNEDIVRASGAKPAGPKKIFS